MSDPHYITKAELFQILRQFGITCVPGGAVVQAGASSVIGFGLPQSLFYDVVTGQLTLNLGGGADSIFTNIGLLSGVVWETFQGVVTNNVTLGVSILQPKIFLIVKDAKPIFHSSLVHSSFDSWTLDNAGANTKVDFNFTGNFTFIAVGYLL